MIYKSGNKLKWLIQALNSTIKEKPFKEMRVDFETCCCAELGEIFIECSGLNNRKQNQSNTVYVWQNQPYVWQFLNIECSDLSETYEVCCKIYEASQNHKPESPFAWIFSREEIKKKKHDYKMQKIDGKWERSKKW